MDAEGFVDSCGAEHGVGGGEDGEDGCYRGFVGEVGPTGGEFGPGVMIGERWTVRGVGRSRPA